MDESLSDPEDRKSKSEEKVENTNTKKKNPQKSRSQQIHCCAQSTCNDIQYLYIKIAKTLSKEVAIKENPEQPKAAIYF